MGKSNRIRSNRENARINAPISNQKKGMPNWVMTLITLVITAAILFSFVAMMFASNGVIGRWKKVMSSGRYEVTSNMMSYFFVTEYNEVASNYSAYLSTNDKAGMLSLNPYVALEKQMYGGDPESGNTYYDKYFFGEFEGTWYDFFLTRAADSVKSMLIYCEYATDNNIALDDNDYKDIEDTLQTFRDYVGADKADSYFSQVIAKGIKEKDVKKCLELSMLANKAILDISDRINASITDEDIVAKYEDNKLDYDHVDYMYYNFKVNYDDVVKEYKEKYKKDNNKELTDSELSTHKDAILDAYRDAIIESQSKARQFAELATAEDFAAALVKMFAEDEVDAAYTSKAENPTGVLKDSKDTIIAEILKEITAEIKDGKTAAKPAVEIPVDEDGKEVDKETAITVYGIDTTVEVAKVINSIKETAFSKTYSSKESYTIEGASYVSDEDEFSKWAFADGRVSGEKKTIFKNDGSSADKKEDIANTQGQSVNYVYFLTKSQYRDDTKTKNFSYSYFGSKEKAEAAINAIKEFDSFKNGTFSTEDFQQLTTDNGALGFQRVTDYQKGGMGISAFDTWLYGDDVTMGSITATPVQDTSNTGYYIVAVYEQPGVENWRVDVKSTLIDERAEAESEALIAKYPVNIKENALKKIKYIGLD